MIREKENRPAGRVGRRSFLQFAGLAGIAATGAGIAYSKGALPGQKTSRLTTERLGATVQQADVAAAVPDDPRIRMHHLLRRAGFTPSEAEVQQALSQGTDATLNALLNPEQLPDPLDPSLQTMDTSTGFRPPALMAWWMGRMNATARPSLEKMTLFWHGFHTSGYDKVGAMNTDLLYTQNVFQRSNAFGNFGDILKGISRQPAMMLYLDLQTDVKAHPNENFARELMELFSMGVGNYTEDDVREGARAFTGYGWDPKGTRDYAFHPAQHDTGNKTYLGQTGNFSGDDAIDIIMQQPATPNYVANKAWSYFAYPNPDPATLAPVAKAFSDTNGDMRATLKAVFTHPQFYSGPSYRALVKSPIEYAVGAARQFQMTPPDTQLVQLAQLAGQVPFYPPNVAGWPGGAAWMNSGSLLARANGANQLLFGKTSFDVGQYLDQNQIATAGDLVDHLLTLLVDGQVPDATRSTLVDYASAGNGDTASLTAIPVAKRDAQVRGTTYLIMSGPEYHLV